ncbi:MAG: VanZ family protein [Bacteroidaceae bacterium]|nr:VanZ family protein [Bacteroidaceae bacterium]
MKHFFRTYLFSTLITAVIVFLSLFNPPHTQLDNVTNIDKLAHFGMYAGLEFFIWIEFLRDKQVKPRLSGFLIMLFFPILLGVLMEIAQSAFTDYRSFEWADMIADSAGAMVCALGCLLFVNRVSGKR